METTYLSSPRALTVISDPIHKFTKLTCFDREVVDSRYFQRLHFVLQNSITYAAYPANKNSRFIHSIGVAELAGQIFVKSINASDKKAALSFLREFKGFIDSKFYQIAQGSGDTIPTFRSNIVKGWQATIRGRSRFAHSPQNIGSDFSNGSKDIVASNSIDVLDSKAKIGSYSADLLVDTLWQAQRLCGLIHDIGHLPMSHSFESAATRVPGLFYSYPFSFPNQKKSQDNARKCFEIALQKAQFGEGNSELEQYLTIVCGFFEIEPPQMRKFLETIEIHERRSLLIFWKIFSDDKFDFARSPEEKCYRMIVFWTAMLILFSSALDKFDISEKIKERGVKTGFLRALKTIVAGEVDADRLDYTVRDGAACGSPIGQFDLARVVENSILVRTGNQFRIVYNERALSGIEQFFTQRRDSYKYLIYHRTSSRSEACLQELIARIYHYAFSFPEDHEFLSILAVNGFISLRGKGIQQVLPLNQFSLEAQDDACLRNTLFHLSNHLQRDKTTGKFKRHLITSILCLSRIVLRRDFRDVYDPFKDSSFRRKLRELSTENATDRELNDFLTQLLTGETIRELSGKIRRLIHEECNGAVSIINVQPPKVFKPKNRVKDHEQVNLISKQSRLVAVEDRSHVLREMALGEGNPFSVGVYFVMDNIKCPENSALRTKIDQTLFNFMLDVLSEHGPLSKHSAA